MMNERKVTVLLVEDSPVDLQLVSGFLGQVERPAYLVQHADCVDAAVRRLSKITPDVVLLDLMLPDSQGIETFHRVHRSAENIPIVVLTHMDDRELALLAVKEGAQDFLFKTDLRADVLSRSIQYAIERNGIQTRLGETVKKLRLALDEVNRLKGLLPICSHCKRIRDDKGYWNQVEDYIGKHADVTFTHGLCPDCFRDLYPEIYFKQPP